METRQLAGWVLGAALLAGATTLYLSRQEYRFVPTAQGLTMLDKQLRDGDLIFRRGRDAVSYVVINADGVTQFSHVGIVLKQHDVAHVIHAVPSEKPGRPDSVVIDTLAFFTQQEHAESYAVYRVKDTDAEVGEKAARLAQSMLGRPFDSDFDLSESGRIYCTELVWLAFQAQGISLIREPEKLDVPFLGQRFILPRTLFSSGLLVPVTL